MWSKRTRRSLCGPWLSVPHMQKMRRSARDFHRMKSLLLTGLKSFVRAAGLKCENKETTPSRNLTSHRGEQTHRNREDDRESIPSLYHAAGSNRLIDGG